MERLFKKKMHKPVAFGSCTNPVNHLDCIICGNSAEALIEGELNIWLLCRYCYKNTDEVIMDLNNSDNGDFIWDSVVDMVAQVLPSQKTITELEVIQMLISDVRGRV